MNCLLYCILVPASRANGFKLPLRGVGDQPLRLVRASGLGAVISAENPATVSVQTAMTYGEVIEELHHCCTLIPMRYGCRFENRLAVQRHLRKRSPAYKRLLTELDGQVEMSIRMLLPDFRERDWGAAGDDAVKTGALGSTEGVAVATEEFVDKKTASPGLAYLESRRRRYQAVEWQQHCLDEIAGALCEQLKGLYKRSKFETGVLAGRQTPCLHFLIARQAVADFRAAFYRQARLAAENHLLLSGPWPPYNFVVEETKTAASVGKKTVAGFFIDN